ncbi:sulfate transporter family protein [Ancylobacter oerskovii]|uniref:Sulfate transporter family protein n=1 Tax=Ancylobacter oerskovii TaxID=459519 RepID=A0ABW4YVJ6_9HYPH|nr:sulfate transporter family protein [Ancylobacter oerskovii]MBS7544379.1 sulfate transporter family protein [Ancylobacter oerskovii]
MLQDAVAAFGRTFSPGYRRVLIRSVLIALGLLAALGIGAHWALTYFVTLQWGWAELTLDILAAVGILIGAIFLVPPVTSLVAGLFLDEVAERAEVEDFPADPPGRALPFARSLAMTLKFFGVMLVVNLIALALLLVPGVNLVVFYIANGYLLGREYFQLAAMRFRGEAEAAEMRRRHGLSIFLAGLIIAAMVSVPILNLATPVFATLFMVRLHKRLSRRAPAS